MEGVLADKAGMDIAVQARSGVMRITGAAGSDEPMRPGASIADFGGGIYLATGILAALFDRERTGEGQEVSVSLLDAMNSLAEIEGRGGDSRCSPGWSTIWTIRSTCAVGPTSPPRRRTFSPNLPRRAWGDRTET